MNCARCGAHLEWWPLRDRWASKLVDTDDTEAWTFICPNRTDTDPYHTPDESRVYSPAWQDEI